MQVETVGAQLQFATREEGGPPMSDVESGAAPSYVQ